MNTHVVNVADHESDVDIQAHLSLANGKYTVQNVTVDRAVFLAIRDTPLAYTLSIIVARGYEDTTAAAHAMGVDVTQDGEVIGTLAAAVDDEETEIVVADYDRSDFYYDNLAIETELVGIVSSGYHVTLADGEGFHALAPGDAVEVTLADDKTVVLHRGSGKFAISEAE